MEVQVSCDNFIYSSAQVFDKPRMSFLFIPSSVGVLINTGCRFFLYLQVPGVSIPPVVQFGSYIHVPVNKCWPHLFSFTGKCKGSIRSGDVRFRRKLQIHDFGVIRLILIDSCFLF